MDAQPWDAEVEKVTVHSLQAILLVAWSARCGLKSRAICIHIRPEAKKHGFLRPGLDDGLPVHFRPEYPRFLGSGRVMLS